MDSRQKIVAGNWKMNKSVSEALALVAAIRTQLPASRKARVVVCPPFTALHPVSAALKSSGIALGAQNLHWEKSGAFTGEVSADMLREVGCEYVIIGHSERRQYFGETDETVNRRLKSALENALIPIVCVGETLAERDGGFVEKVLERQLRGGLAGVSAEAVAGLVVAYEPVWAIGTGRNASPQQAQDAHQFIRSVLADLAGPDVARKVPIQYGGSVKASNAGELFGQPDIDGGLIGGAALDAASFIGIIQAAG